MPEQFPDPPAFALVQDIGHDLDVLTEMLTETLPLPLRVRLQIEQIQCRLGYLEREIELLDPSDCIGL